MSRRGLSSRLRQRVDLMRKTQVDNGKGGYTSSWAAVRSKLPAEVIGLTGSEAVKEKILRGIRVYRVTVRHRGDVLPKDQLRYGTEDLNIRSAVDPDGRREQLVIIADTDGAVATT